MAMLELSPKSLLCGVLLAASACSPPHMHVEEDGPEVVLTAAEPTADFEVTVCVDRPRRVAEFSPGIRIQADIDSGSASAGIVRGRLVDTMDERQEDELDLADSPEAGLSFNIESTDAWNEEGRHCTEPQLVRFEYEGDDPMLDLRMSWSVTLSGRFYYDDSWGRDFEHDDVTIDIEPLQ